MIRIRRLYERNRRFWARLRFFGRRVGTIVQEFANDEIFSEDDEYIGLGRYRIASIKWTNSALAYQSIYRFPNYHGAIVLRGEFISDPWEIIPITFVRLIGNWCPYFTITGEEEYVPFWGSGYTAYDQVLRRLESIKAMEPPAEIELSEYYAQVPIEKRLYPLKWLQVFTDSPRYRRQ